MKKKRISRIKEFPARAVATSAIGVWIVALSLAPHDSALRFVYLAAHYVLIPSVLVFLLFRRLTDRLASDPCRLSCVDRAMALYLVYAAVSACISVETFDQWESLLIVIYRSALVPFAVYWLIRLARVEEPAFRSLAPVFALLLVLETAIALIAWRAPDVLPGIWPGFVTQLGGARITGTFGQPDVYSAALFFFGSMCLHYSLASRRRSLRLAGGILFVMGLAGIFFSFSRASWLAAAMSVLFLGVFVEWKKLLALAAAAAVLIGLSSTFFHRDLNYAAKRLLMTETIKCRLISNQAGARMFWASPVLGWGYGSYDQHDARFVEPFLDFQPTDWDVAFSTSHNSLLTLLAETGLAGTFLYLFPCFWFFWHSVRAVRKGFLSRNSECGARYLAALWVNLGFIAVISMFIDIRFFPFALVLIWLLLGLVANSLDGEKGSSKTTAGIE